MPDKHDITAAIYPGSNNNNNKSERKHQEYREREGAPEKMGQRAKNGVATSTLLGS